MKSLIDCLLEVASASLAYLVGRYLLDISTPAKDLATIRSWGVFFERGEELWLLVRAWFLWRRSYDHN